MVLLAMRKMLEWYIPMIITIASAGTRGSLPSHDIEKKPLKKPGRKPDAAAVVNAAGDRRGTYTDTNEAVDEQKATDIQSRKDVKAEPEANAPQKEPNEPKKLMKEITKTSDEPKITSH